MLRIELAPWEKAKSQAQRIRVAVFVEEQGVPPELEMDEHDDRCMHALAFVGKEAVGTGRLLRDGHIGRMAVLKPWRGRGVGAALLRALVQAARERGDGEVLLSAQVHALPFYRAHGFAPFGDIYEEAGIPHQAMRLRLA